MKPPRRVLAAVDFSEPSRSALAFGARLASQFGSELHVMHAQHPLLSAAAAHHGIDLARQTEDELRAFAAATWPAERCALLFDVIVGPAAPTIAAAADRESADLIIVASRGISGTQRALLGSTADGLLRRSGAPVLVIPDGWQPAAPDRADLRGEGPIIAGVDFRIPALEAASYAAVLATALGTELVLAHIVPSLAVLPRWRQHAEEALIRRATDAKREIERVAANVGRGVPTRVMVERGGAASCLVEIARTHPHAIVAVGRTVHPSGQAPPGTTAYRVAAQAQRPVLMHVAR